jgi:hypothetical protein
MKGRISGSVFIIGAKSEVVVRHPFDAPSPYKTPISALTSFASTRCGGLHALTWSITRIEQMPSLIAMTSRRWSPLWGVSVTSSNPALLYASGYYFLPFFPGELISNILVFLQKCNDVKPRNCNRLDQLSLARLWAGYNSRNDKLCVEVDWPDLNRPAKLYAVRTRSRTVIRTRRPLFRLYVPAFVEHRSAIAAEGYVRHVLRPIGIVSSNLAGCAISV